MNKTQKRIISYVLSMGMLLSAVPATQFSASAAENAFPDAVFAASTTDAIITADSLCVNGNISANGNLILSEAANINGKVTDNAGRARMFVFDKLDRRYFQNADVFENGYTLEDINLNLNNPFTVTGSTGLNGNINLNTAVKAVTNIEINGESLNANNAVLYSKYGDIVINSSNVNYSGLIYAPLGKVVFTGQNVNLNSAVVIAEEIECDAVSANINYNQQVAEFIGTESELLDIPYDDWQYMEDEDGSGIPDFFEDINNWNLLVDTDGDRLPDAIEVYLETDPLVIDTDGDGIDEYYEVMVLWTDPTTTDTDHNGISDFDEDNDKDGLSNGLEYQRGTNPNLKDSDDDRLKDGEEVYTYGTNPLNPDTDGDGIYDGDEILLGTDSLTPDENTNTSFTKVFTPEDFYLPNDGSYPEVEFTSDAKGILTFQMTTRPYNNFGFNPFMPGFTKPGINLSTEGEFGSAVLRYHLTDEELADPDFVPAIYYFNEELGTLEELENVQLDGNILSVRLEHFSGYTLLNKKQFDQRFKETRGMLQYLSPSDDIFSNEKTDTDLVFVLDDSGSMRDNDPSNMRKSATTAFIDQLPDTDNVAIYSFTTSQAKCLMQLTPADENGKNKADQALAGLKNYGGTDGTQGLHAAVNLLSNRNNVKCVIFLTDGTDTTNYYSYSDIIDDAQKNAVTIFTIGLKNYANGDRLDQIATETGGKFFEIDNLKELKNCYEEIRELTVDYITDSNGDGISDYYTWKLCSGQMTDGYGNYVFPFGNPYAEDATPVRYANHSMACEVVKAKAKKIFDEVQKNDDFDGDGAKNGDEVMIQTQYYRTYARVYSDPMKTDTDGDNLNDGIEKNKIGSDPSLFSVLCRDNQIRNLADSGTFIASYYKDQYFDGAFNINKAGMVLSKIYGRNPMHEIYLKEISDDLTALYNISQDRSVNKDEQTWLAWLADRFVELFPTGYSFATAKLISKIRAPHAFNADEYYAAVKEFQKLRAAEDGFKRCPDLATLTEYAKEFRTTEYAQKMIHMGEFHPVEIMREGTACPSGVIFTAFAVFNTAMEGLDVLNTCVDLTNSCMFFNDVEDVLNRAYAATTDSQLRETIAFVMENFKDEKDSHFKEVQTALCAQYTTQEAIFQTVHLFISYCGAVGTAMELMVGVGNLAGISETAQYAYRTVCSASLADALGKSWGDTCREKTHPAKFTSGIPGWYADETGSYAWYASPEVLCNYQYYVIGMRKKANDNFKHMESCGYIVGWIKQKLQKDAMETAATNDYELSKERMSQVRMFIDATKNAYPYINTII